MKIHSSVVVLFFTLALSSSAIGQGFGSSGLFNLNAFLKVSRFEFIQLTARVSALETSVTNMTRTVAQLSVRRIPTCPSTVPTFGTGASSVIGTYCYFVDTSTVSFAQALINCQSYGGTLAEPAVAFSTPLYTALKAALPLQFITIEAANTGKLWIGAQWTSTNPAALSYVSTGQQVPGPIAAVSDQAALLTKPGNPWTVVQKSGTTYPYVCQIATVS